MIRYNVWAIIEEIDIEKQENGKDINARKLAIFNKETDADNFLENIWVDDILEECNGLYPYEGEIKDNGRRIKEEIKI